MRFEVGLGLSGRRLHAVKVHYNDISRKVAVTLPEFSFCFSKNVLTQSCSPSLGEMVPDIFVCWPGGGGFTPPPPPFNSTLARLGVNGSKTLFTVFSALPVLSSDKKSWNLQRFLWLSGKKHRKNRWFFMRLG